MSQSGIARVIHGFFKALHIPLRLPSIGQSATAYYKLDCCFMSPLWLKATRQSHKTATLVIEILTPSKWVIIVTATSGKQLRMCLFRPVHHTYYTVNSLAVPCYAGLCQLAESVNIKCNLKGRYHSSRKLTKSAPSHGCNLIIQSRFPLFTRQTVFFHNIS